MQQLMFMNAVYIAAATLVLSLASFVQATEPSLTEINNEIELGLLDQSDAQAQLKEDEDLIRAEKAEIERLLGEIAVKKGGDGNVPLPVVAVGVNADGAVVPVQFPALSFLISTLVALSHETRKELKELEADLKLATDAYSRLIAVYQDDLKRLSFTEAELQYYQELKAELEALEAKEAR